MSTMEISPQKQKPFNNQQDHGDAPSENARAIDRGVAEYDRRAKAKREAARLKAAFNDDIDYTSMTSAQLEAEATRILSGKGPYTTETPLSPREKIIKEAEELDYDDEDTVDTNLDGFLTEADLGLRSLHEIGKLMARRVTLDPSFYEDDMGDSDYESPLRITRTPR